MFRFIKSWFEKPEPKRGHKVGDIVTYECQRYFIEEITEFNFKLAPVCCREAKHRWRIVDKNTVLFNHSR